MSTKPEPAAPPLLTVLLPHYKTLGLAKLCLRSLKLHTDLRKVKVVVIDNDSADESLIYLRSLSWVTLVENKNTGGDRPAAMHAKALDMGMAAVTTPYVVSMHTDTIVTSDAWLDFLLGKIQQSDDIAGVGSWKLEYQSPLRTFGKALEHLFQTAIWFPLTGKGEGKIAGVGKNYYYLRSHCALYRTELVRKYTGGFFDEEEETAGKALHRKLVENGFKMVFLPAGELGRFMQHLNHATMILNPHIAGVKTGSPNAYKRIMRELNNIRYEQILNDPSLD